MTTIVYKNGVVAYDSRSTRGDMIDDDDCEKSFEVGGMKFFLGGCGSDYENFIKAYLGTPYTGHKLDVTALVLDPPNLYYASHSVEEGVWKDKVDIYKPFAIGSGTAYAYTAMDMGCEAEKAVKMAMLRDIYTGGRVRWIDVSKMINLHIS